MHDVIIIGAGSADLSAAHLLARCRRTAIIKKSEGAADAGAINERPLGRAEPAFVP